MNINQWVAVIIALFFMTSAAVASTDIVQEVAIERAKQVPAVFNALPRYPKALRERGLGGSIKLDYMVDKRGNASNFRVVETTSRALVRSAMIALKKSKFQKPTRNGRPVFVRHQSRSYIYSVSENGATVEIR